MKKKNNGNKPEENIDNKNNSVEKETEIIDDNNKNIELEEDSSPSPQTEQIDFEEKYNTLNDTYLRLMADFDNYRKRTIKEKADLISNGGEKIIIGILPIVDNFERALHNMETSTEIKALKEGVELIYQQLLSTLSKQGVKAIETQGADFDTEFHEAITTIPAPKEEDKGKILDCTLKGYTLNDKVIRYSKVVIGE